LPEATFPESKVRVSAPDDMEMIYQLLESGDAVVSFDDAVELLSNNWHDNERRGALNSQEIIVSNSSTTQNFKGYIIQPVSVLN